MCHVYGKLGNIFRPNTNMEFKGLSVAHEEDKKFTKEKCSLLEHLNLNICIRTEAKLKLCYFCDAVYKRREIMINQLECCLCCLFKNS